MFKLAVNTVTRLKFWICLLKVGFILSSKSSMSTAFLKGGGFKLPLHVVCCKHSENYPQKQGAEFLKARFYCTTVNVQAQKMWSVLIFHVKVLLAGSEHKPI